MDAPALRHDTVDARHAERLCRSLRAYAVLHTRRRRLRCPLSAVRSRLVARRPARADVFGPPLPR
jgi:hypothetical protein